MDARFFVDVAGNGDRRGCWHSHQTHGSKGPPVCEIGAALGWSTFQYEISRVSIRSRSSVDGVFWRFDFRAAPCRTRLFADTNSDRVLPNVPRRALLVRCCVRGRAGDSMCRNCLAIFATRTNGPPITIHRSPCHNAPQDLKSESKSKNRIFKERRG